MLTEVVAANLGKPEVVWDGEVEVRVLEMVSIVLAMR